ncbi:uncharacterized protein LOC107371386 [Tetranychus urticae]|uniref:uncharacterized protein LOC107371386 n=1 Tax=Tetranychus urticae TaxID=32264 RepID=UPI00077BCCF7|nr:uncharacterized protein LOC107371386 [Tetranychus urticae]
MDDPNYKMKNMYSSVSPSEIALRCTILDLCQRLKRTEVLCDYYEQCRNELVSDCIRLRQERDYYLMAHRNHLQKAEASKPKINQVNNQNTGPKLDNKLNQVKKQPSFSFEKEIDFPKTAEVDDNYEEIAKRLIAQFREEMEEIRRASMNGSQTVNTSEPSTGSNVFKGRTSNQTIESTPTMIATSTKSQSTPFHDDSGISTKMFDTPGCTPSKSQISSSQFMGRRGNDPASNYNVDYGEKILIYDVLDDVQKGPKFYHSNQGITKKDSTENDKLTHYDGLSSAYQRNQQGHARQRNTSTHNNGFPKEEEQNILKDTPTIIEVNSNRDIYSNQTGDAGVDAAPQVPSNSEADQYIDLCYKLLKSSINDFDTLTRMLMNQNEKLRKLKGKQLRSYFKRQLDQNNETTSNTKRP